MFGSGGIEMSQDMRPRNQKWSTKFVAIAKLRLMDKTTRDCPTLIAETLAVYKAVSTTI